MRRCRRAPATSTIDPSASWTSAVTEAARRLLVAAMILPLVACGAADGDGAGGDATASGPGSPAAAEAAEESGSAASPAETTGDEGGGPALDFPSRGDLERIPRAYAYAAKYPDLFARIPCYCPCALYGHPGLDGCYRSQHAAQCSACLEEGLIAGRMYEEAMARGEADAAAVAEQVKQRFRSVVVRNALRQMPMADTPKGRAFVQTCSQCHQLPHPGMYAAGDWKKSLSRMRSYARQQDLGVDDRAWESAEDYIREISSRYPESAGERYRAELAAAVEKLQAEEGEAAYYPGAQDPILGTEWFERMVKAYRTAEDLPAPVLASTRCDCGNCAGRDHETLLACLESGHAISCERAVELVEEIAARQGA